MKQKIIFMLIFSVLLASFAYADVLSISFWDESSSEELTIVDGQSAGFTIVGESLGEPHMQIKTDLYRSGEFVATLLDMPEIEEETYATHFTLNKNIYQEAGDYVVTTTVHGASNSETSQLLLHVQPVSDGNSVPVITSTAVSSVNENDVYRYRLLATDADGDDLSYRLTQKPSWLSVNQDGLISGRSPLVTRNENFAVTVEVSDGQDFVRQTYVLTVLDVEQPSVNHVPIIRDVPSQEISEGETLDFNVRFSDPDGDVLVGSFTSDIPAGDLRMEIVTENEEVRFTWDTDFEDAGTYTITYTVEDGETSVSKDILVTVNNVNREPVLTSIGHKTVEEDDILTFVVSATDSDRDSLTYSATGLPRGADLDSDTQVFTWIPDFDQAGSYDVTFSVTDGDDTVEETITITVTNVNRAPILDTIENKAVNEGTELIFTVTASDADGDLLIFSAENIPTGAIFDADTQTFTWTPTSAQADAAYTVTFRVSDGVLSDSETIIIDVDKMIVINTAPVLDAIGDKEVTEGDQLSFTVTATDADGGALTFSADIPANADFDADTQTFSWTTVVGDAGIYTATFSVTDGEDTAEETITITINELIIPNTAPVLDLIGPKTVAENEELIFTVTATDVDGDALTFSVDNLPLGSVFDETTQTFTWTPTFDQEGSYDITFTVTDGEVTAEETVAITVTNVNREPTIIPVDDQEIFENEVLDFTVRFSDLDMETLIGSFTSDIPAGDLRMETVTENEEVRFTWDTDYDTAGTYTITFTVEDAETSVEETIPVTVNNVNREPVLDEIGDKRITQSNELSFIVSGSDPDGDALTFSATDVPTGAVFDADTRTFTWTPTEAQIGDHGVTFTVTDTQMSTEETITITVLDVNHAPLLDLIGPQEVAENEFLGFSVSATDEDGDTLTFSVNNLPTGSVFDETTQTFTWAPGLDQAGNYDVTFSVTDGELTDEEIVTIVVTNTNQAPDFEEASIEDRTVAENNLLEFTIGATDADGDVLTYSVSDLPLGATFDDLTHTFTWTPNLNQAGSYDVTFTVTDGTLSSDATVTISVTNVNQAPVLNAIGPQEVQEGDTLLIVVTASEYDGDEMTFSATNLPLGADFNEAAQTFTWTPGLDQAGSYDVTFSVTDREGLTDEEVVTITVTNTNQAPLFDADSVEDVEVNENELLSGVVRATDADGDALTYSVSDLPAGAEFDETTQLFTWVPGFDQAGTHQVIFTVTDGVQSTDAIVTITVGNTDREPELVEIGNKVVNENKLLTFIVTATDEDGDDLTYSVSGLPTDAKFDETTQTFSWTPTYDQAGSYEVTFTVSGAELSVEETITITVVNVNRGIVILSKPIDIADEGTTYRYQFEAVDADNDPLTYSLIEGPRGMTIDENGLVLWEPFKARMAHVMIAVTDGEFTEYQRYSINSRTEYSNVRLSRVLVSPEVASPNDYVQVYVNVDNNGDHDMEDMRVSITIPELGIKRSTGEFDLDQGNEEIENVVIPVPYFAWPGEYLVKVTVSNSEYHESAYRLLTIN